MSATATTTTPPLDLTNIQGDILCVSSTGYRKRSPLLTTYHLAHRSSGLPKKTQTYLFFQITDSNAFRTALSDLVPLITTTEQVVNHRQTISDHKKKSHGGNLLDIVGVNIAFSHSGLTTVRIIERAPFSFEIGD